MFDFRAPNATLTASVGDSETDSAPRFLYLVARCALGRRTSPLPLSAFRLLAELSKADTNLEQAVRAVDAAGAAPDQITRQRRGMTLTLSLLSYVFGVIPLGRMVQAVVPTRSLTATEVGLLACFVLAVAMAAAMRGGLWLKPFGIAVVTGDGREVSRFRAGLRAAVAWSWAPIQVAMYVFGGPWLLLLIVKIVALAHAADNPSRSLQDALAGTHLVPR